jgi:hypothetical protein
LNVNVVLVGASVPFASPFSDHSKLAGVVDVSTVYSAVVTVSLVMLVGPVRFFTLGPRPPTGLVTSVVWRFVSVRLTCVHVSVIATRL